GTRALHIGRLVGSAAARVREPTHHRCRAGKRRDALARLHSITSSAATTMFAVLRGRALSRLEIDDQLEFPSLLDWQACMLAPAEFGGRCLRNLGRDGFDMFLPRGRRSSAVTWPKDECADEFFREPRDRSVPPPEWSRIPPARGPDQ